MATLRHTDISGAINANKCCFCSNPVSINEGINDGEKIVPIHMTKTILVDRRYNSYFSCEEVLYKIIKTLVSENPGINVQGIMDMAKDIDFREFVLRKKIVDPIGINNSINNINAQKGLLAVLNKHLKDGDLYLSEDGQMITKEKKDKKDTIKKLNESFTTTTTQPKKIIIEEKNNNGPRMYSQMSSNGLKRH